MMASVEEGILDMMGPRTLEGGYSPSQVMSSAKRMVEEDCSEILGANATWWVALTAVWEAGTNAEERATMAARMRMLRRAIFGICVIDSDGVLLVMRFFIGEKKESFVD